MAKRSRPRSDSEAVARNAADGPNQQSKTVVHGPRSGERWMGNAFNIPGTHLPPSAPRYFANGITDGNRNTLRPVPGLRPWPYQFSLRHGGSEPSAATSIDGPDGMLLWCLNGGPFSQNLLVLFNHRRYLTGPGGQHPFGDEALLIIPISWSTGKQAFLNHQPLIARDSNGEWDFDGAGYFKPSNYGTGIEHVSTGRGGNMVVIATDGNAVKAVHPSDDDSQLTVRNIGLNPPAYEPNIKVGTLRGHGAYLPQRLHPDDGGDGVWKTEPHDIVTIPAGDRIQIDMGSSGLSTAEFVKHSRLFIVPITGSGDIGISGIKVDNDTTENFYGHTETVTLVAATAYRYDPGASAWTTTTARQYVDWRETADAGEDADYDDNITEAYYKTESYLNQWLTITNNSGSPMSLLVFRKADPIREEGDFTGWRASVAFSKKTEVGEVRGAKALQRADNAFIWIDVNKQIRLANFSDPLGDDEPDTMIVMVNKFVTNASRAEDEGEGDPNYFIVREIPIHKVSGTWKTDTGDSSNDLPLSQVVVDCPYSEFDIPLEGRTYPGGLQTMGGARVVSSWNGCLLAANFPEVRVSGVSAAPSNDAAARQFTCTTNDFEPWWVGRRFLYEPDGKTYTIERIEETDASSTATLVTVERFTGASSTGTMILLAEKNVLRMSLGIAAYNEMWPVTYRWELPDSSDEIVALLPDRGRLLIGGRRPNIYMMTWFGGQEFEPVEDLSLPNTSDITRVSTDIGPGGLYCFTPVERGTAYASGRGIAWGLDPDMSRTITDELNARCWTDLFDRRGTTHAQMAYDQPHNLALLSNIRAQSSTYPEFAEYGVTVNFREDRTLGLVHPCTWRALGVAQIAQDRWGRSSIREGVCCFLVQVSTLGSSGKASQTGAHLAIYDSITGEWAAVYVNDATISAVEQTSVEPTSKHVSALQTTDGKILAFCGNSLNGLRGRAKVKWNSSSSETNKFELEDFGSSNDFAATYFWGWTHTWDRKFVALGLTPDSATAMSIYRWDSGDISYPSNKEIAGARYDIDGAAFTKANMVKGIATGPSGELYVVAWVYTSATDAVLHIRTIDPEKMQPMIDDQTVSITTKAATRSGGKGPREFALNRHRELFWTEIATNAGTDYLRVHRYRFPSEGYAGGDDELTLTSGTELALPSGETWCRLMVSHRNEAIVAAPYDAGSGRIGTRVYMWSELDANAVEVDIDRASYHRRCLGILPAGNYYLLIFEDTPTAGGTVEYKAYLSVGDIIDDGDDPIEDGRIKIDETASSRIWDITETIAGTGGALSAVQVQGNDGVPNDSGATNWLMMRGLPEQ